MEKTVLCKDKSECCGCGACMNACPKGAISLQEDESGFVYPIINEALCIGCGACEKVCGYGKGQMRSVLNSEVYAAAIKNRETLKKAASGGIFAAIAEYYLNNGGIVYGAALVRNKDSLYPKHIRIDKIEDLEQLLGSKYVQSDMGYCYQQIKRDLENHLEVLFSGTPCQVVAVKSFLKKEYKNLFTIDLICHGVPGRRLFSDFLAYYEKQLKGKITEFYFRDKSKGQGEVTRCVYVDKNGKTKVRVKSGDLLAYMHFFSKAYTLRTNCYSCPYANLHREGDITVGDYWGFHEEYPYYSEKRELSNGRGISCVLIHSEKGCDLIHQLSYSIDLMESAMDKLCRHNEQLVHPSHLTGDRETVLRIYRKSGYKGLNSLFYRDYKGVILKSLISSLVPKTIKRKIKKAIGRMRY